MKNCTFPRGWLVWQKITFLHSLPSDDVYHRHHLRQTLSYTANITPRGHLKGNHLFEVKFAELVCLPGRFAKDSE